MRDDGMSFNKIGEKFNISRQRVHQIIGKTRFIYIIKCNNFYKIGLSNGSENRLKMLQIGNPYPLELVGKFPSFYAPEVERKIHQTFKRKHHHGEWFKDIDNNDIKMIEEIIDKKINWINRKYQNSYSKSYSRA